MTPEYLRRQYGHATNEAWAAIAGMLDDLLGVVSLIRNGHMDSSILIGAEVSEKSTSDL